LLPHLLTHQFPTRLPRRVPVIRVFGSTPCGQTCCLHVHCVFRHMLVPAPEAWLDLPPRTIQPYLKAIADRIDSALEARQAAQSGGADGGAGGGACGGGAGGGGGGFGRGSFGPRAWVYNMRVEMMTPFYGYHAEPRQFIKIWCAEPIS